VRWAVLGSLNAAVSAQPPAAFDEAGPGAERSELSRLRRADAASLARATLLNQLLAPKTGGGQRLFARSVDFA
jgi:hypothetical protein